MSNAIHQATLLERERCAKHLDLSQSDVLLMAGEMTAQEMRTVMAVLSCLRVRIRSDMEPGMMNLVQTR